MTIKEFSKLCGCNPQTLRYYDHQNLLKPVKVDEWSGYRYYDESQALIFVKIKNLQKAGFTINEVKELLQKDSAEIYHAFEMKIVEEEQRIREIKEIQKSYQSEMISMINKVEELRELLKEARESYDPTEEFGISKDEYEATSSILDSLLAEIDANGDLSKLEFNDYKNDPQGAEERYFESVLSNPNYSIAYEKHGWQFVKEFFSEISDMDEHKGYLLMFRLVASKQNKTAFANTVIGLCCAQSDAKLKIGCTVLDSKDDKNHFWLMTYQDSV